jgi:hypothetical protein
MINEQSARPPERPRRSRGWLWIVLTVIVAVVVVAGGVVLAVPLLRQAVLHVPGGASTATPGPWYLANGGKCVQLRTPAPTQISNVQVSRDTYLAHSEPEIAENPLNPLNLVGGSKFFTNPARYQFKIGYYTSFDGGCTWTDGGFLPGYERYNITSDISFAFDRHNDVYAAVLVDGETGDGQFSGVAVSRSTDGGRHFAPPTLIHPDATGATFSDKPWIGVDTTNGPHAGSIYVVWNLDDNNSPSAPIYFSRSTDGGKTFSPGMEISGDSSVCQFGAPAGGAKRCDSALGATPVISPDGTISVVYAYLDPNRGAQEEDDNSSGDVNGDVRLSGQADLASCQPLPPDNFAHTHLLVVQSKDGGATWNAPVDAATVYDIPFHFNNSCFRNFSLPAFAADPTKGTLYLSWADERNGDADILLARSTDGGTTWSAPVRVNDDPVGNGKDQFQPQVAVAPNGVVSVMFFDRRNDPNNVLIDTYLAQSTNGGQSFHPNVRVTTVSWNPSTDAPLPNPGGLITFIGDYQGLAVDNHFAHVFWNDTRTGAQEIFTAAMPSVQPEK